MESKKRRTASKRLLQLNIAFPEHKWLTWENVGHMGKNNIKHLIKEIRKEISRLKRQATHELGRYNKRILPHTKGSKELGAMKQVLEMIIQHRQEVITMLTAIAKTVPNKPQLPGCGRINIPFGEVAIDLFGEDWSIATNEYSNSFDSGRYATLPVVKKLRACNDREYIRTMKRIIGRATDFLLTMPLPTEHEIVTKRLSELSNLRDRQGRPSDELLALIAQDEAWLAADEKGKKKEKAAATETTEEE